MRKAPAAICAAGSATGEGISDPPSQIRAVAMAGISDPKRAVSPISDPPAGSAMMARLWWIELDWLDWIGPV